MKPSLLFATILSILFCGHAVCQTNDIDTGLANLATNLTAQIRTQGKKKVAVIDFTDLSGGTSGELGKYIAEQLTVNLVMDRKGFSVLDRANLNKILAEHKLTAKGLIDPDTAKKLGMFAGVDALILGTIVPEGHNIELTAKIITTDTAEIVGAARSEFKVSATVEQLTNAPAPPSESQQWVANSSQSQKPKIVRTFPTFSVQINSLRIVNGRQYLLTMTFTNSTRWLSSLALEFNSVSRQLTSVVTDPEGYEFHASIDNDDIKGIPFAYMDENNSFGGNATPLRTNDSIQATVKFSSPPGRIASPGLCHVQLEILVFSVDGYGKIINWNRHSVIADIKTE